MAKTVDFNIVGSYNNQRVTNIDPERTVNLFEYIDPLGKKPKSLIPTSGLVTSSYTFGAETKGFRAEYVLLGFHYLIVGASIFRIDSSGVMTTLYSALATDEGYAAIDANEFQIIFVDGVDGYVWDTITSTFTQITDPAFPATPIDVTVLDQFAVVADGNTNNFYLSSLNNALIWGPDNSSVSSPTKFVIAEGTSTVILTFPSGVSISNYQIGTPIQLSAPSVNVSTFTMGAGTTNVVITYVGGDTIADYAVGTPIVFSGGAIPAEFNAVDTFYVESIVSPTTITVSATYGGAAINSAAGGNGNISNKGIPAELSLSTTYYVRSHVSATSITISATNGGAAISSTLGGNGGLTNNGQLQVGSITTHPGNIVACKTLHRRLFLFSQNYTEIWENAGIGTTLPFRRNNSLLMEYGTPAIGSVAAGFDILMFLSQDREGLGSVMMVSGTESIPVSTRALDFTLSQYVKTANVSDCRSFLVKENGIIFYRMNFTEANHTFVYNVSQSNPQSDETKFWHEEEVLNGDRHPAQTHGYFNGHNYVGSYDSPVMYQLSPFVYLNGDEKIRRMRITRALVPPGYQRIRIDRLQVDLLQGDIININSQYENLTLLTEDQSELLAENGEEILLEQELLLNNPDDLEVFLSISKDGGQTYGYLVKAPMGQIGERSFRTLWRKLGTTKRGQPFVCKFQFFNDYPFIILGACWAIEELPE